MLLYGFGGRAVLDRIKRVARGQIVERALGVVLLATGVADGVQPRRPLRGRLGKDTSLPAFLTDPTQRLETLERRPERARVAAAGVAVRRAPEGRRAPNAGVASRCRRCRTSARRRTSPTPRTGSTRRATGRCRSPACAVTSCWSTSGPTRASTASARCRSSRGLYQHYHRYGLDIVGVETPEFTFEQEAEQRPPGDHSDGITYPVVQDNRYGTWDAYQNEYWPAEYFIDARRGPSHPVRRGQLRAGRGGRARAADGGRRKHLPAPMTAQADDRRRPNWDARDLPRTRSGAAGLRRAAHARVHAYTAPANLGAQRVGAERQLERRLAVDHAARHGSRHRSPAACRPATSTW